MPLHCFTVIRKRKARRSRRKQRKEKTKQNDAMWYIYAKCNREFFAVCKIHSFRFNNHNKKKIRFSQDVFFFSPARRYTNVCLCVCRTLINKEKQSKSANKMLCWSATVVTNPVHSHRPKNRGIGGDGKTHVCSFLISDSFGWFFINFWYFLFFF